MLTAIGHPLTGHSSGLLANRLRQPVIDGPTWTKAHIDSRKALKHFYSLTFRRVVQLNRESSDFILSVKHRLELQRPHQYKLLR